MANNRTRASYDELKRAAQQWAREAENAQRMVMTLTQNMDALQAGDWVGQGARAFYAEMNSQVLPSLNRLVAALGKAGTTTLQISQLVKDAEDAAAAVLNGRGVGSVSETTSGVTTASAGGSETASTGTSGTSSAQAQGQFGNPLLVRDPRTLFQDSNLRGLIGTSYAGADTGELRSAMTTLWENRHTPNSPAAQQALQQVADLRGQSLSDIQTGWQKYQQVLTQQEQLAQGRGDAPAEGLNWMHPHFMGSTSQLRSGQVVGEAFGVDPVFGALLNPSGGLVGPGNNAVDLDDSSIGYHGAVHDAAGYLYNFHNTGPGYDYLGREGRDTSDPLSGQREGIKYWRETLPGPNPGGYAGEWVMRGVVGGVDLGKKVWGDIKSIF